MPGPYPMLPHLVNDWIVTMEGKTLDRDLFPLPHGGVFSGRSSISELSLYP